MLSRDQWDSLTLLKPVDFQNPDMMQYSIVSALDRFSLAVGSKPIILSDGRPGDPRQHGNGLAVDTFWVAQNPLHMWDLSLSSNLFSGIGIYYNENNAVSFHYDLRHDRSVYSPALWGDLVTRVNDPETGEPARKDEYVSADVVLTLLKKKLPGMAIGLGLLLLGLWLMRGK